MTAESCCIDGRPFKKLEREFVCVVCACKVCGEHSTGSRTNPFTGEGGHACQRCLSETVDGTLEAQVAALHRQLQSLGPALKSLTAEVQALREEVQGVRQEIANQPAPRPRVARSRQVIPKPAKAPARRKKPPAPVA